MHPLQVGAFRRELSRADREAAIAAWQIFADVKGLLGALYAASTLAVCGRLTAAQYRTMVGELADAATQTVEQLREIRFHADEERAAFGEALLAFQHALQTCILAPAEETLDLAASAAHAYAAGRALGRSFWVLEMRPEGLPLTPLALEQYAPLGEGME